jgi:hypothetical protein
MPAPHRVVVFAVLVATAQTVQRPLLNRSQRIRKAPACQGCSS